MYANTIANQFTSAAAHYAAAIQPFALKLFLALLFIEVLVTAIQFMMDQGEAPHYIGRVFRHLLGAGFIYLMLVNAFPWMTAVMSSFAAIGSAVSGVPKLNPSTVLDIGGHMAETIYSVPSSTGALPNLAIVIGQTIAAFFILLTFTMIAATALLVVIEAYLVVGGAAILLGFGGSRFTASIAEGYFGYVIRAGVRLLFFYLVLGIGVQIATHWNAALTAACHPVTTTLPWYGTYGVPPTSIITTTCSSPLNWHLLLNLVADSVILMIISIAVPWTAASIVSGTVGLALVHAFEAAYIARTVIQPINSIVRGATNTAIKAFGGNDGSLEARLAYGRQAAQTTRSLGLNVPSAAGQPNSQAAAPTLQLNRSTGSQPNKATSQMRPDRGTVGVGPANSMNGTVNMTHGKPTSKI